MRATPLPVLLALLASLAAQEPASRPARRAAADAPLAQAPRWRSLGPASMSGRIVDLAVDPGRRAVWYVATASGGLFKTENAGTSWAPVFDHARVLSLGAVAVAPSDPRTVWVGTGEANARNSVSWGDGVHVSRDGGKTWRHAGLQAAFQIGRIAVHPQDPNTAYVAACGRLWGPNPERGLYRTRDGGASWVQVLKVDERTGAVDVALHPAYPDQLIAATWERARDEFDGNDPSARWGPGSGLWKSIDAGDSWRRLGAGLPTVAMGRIGLTVAAREPWTVYAVIETERIGWAAGDARVASRPSASRETGGASSRGRGERPAGFEGMLGGQLENVQERQGPLGFECGGVFRSDDFGESWRRVNSLNPRPFYYSQIRVDPADPERVYVLGINYYSSADGGRSFEQARGHDLHPDFHALWIDPANPEHMIIGQDAGLAETWDRGKRYRYIENLPCGQYYHAAVDDGEPYLIYGGLQDNGTWAVPSRTRFQDGVINDDAFRLGGGDGFTALPHPGVPGLVFFESQLGGLAWRDLETGRSGGVARPAGARLRFNWDTPVLLSAHAPDTVWYAGNQVVKAAARGAIARRASPELARTPRGTATVLAESPLTEGLLYAGTDDGALWATLDGGGSWERLHVPGLPGPRYVSGIEPSRFAEGRVFLALDGHRCDDMRVYLFASEDYGRHWAPLGPGVDRGPVHEVREGRFNPDLLYAATEFDLFASLDRGASWFSLRGDMPAVAVRDLAIQARERELVAATHGRGLYILDCAGLEACTRKAMAEPAALFQPVRAVQWASYPSRARFGASWFRSPNPPSGTGIHFWLAEKPPEAPLVTVLDPAGQALRSLQGAKAAGLQSVFWDLRREGQMESRRTRQGRPGPPVEPGTYGIRLEAGGQRFFATVAVVQDPVRAGKGR